MLGVCTPTCFILKINKIFLVGVNPLPYICVMDFTPIVKDIKKTNFLSRYKLKNWRGKVVGDFRITSIKSGDDENVTVYVCITSESTKKMSVSEVLYNYKHNDDFIQNVDELKDVLSCLGLEVLGVVVENIVLKKEETLLTKVLNLFK